MRIAYLVSQYPASSHTFIRREIEALRARGADIQIYSVRPPSQDELASDRDKAAFAETTYLLPMSPLVLIRSFIWALVAQPRSYFSTLRLALNHRAPGMRAWLWSIFYFAEAIVLARALRADGIDRLHNHFANAGANVGLFATQFLGIPWSLTLHGISETDYPAGLLLARKIEAAEFVACVSWFGRAQAMRITPVEQWSKLSIVRCGIDLDEMRSAGRRSAGSAVDRIVCVGRLSPEKGQLGLLEAVAGIKGHGSRFELVLVGDGPDRDVVERHVRELGLQSSVRLLGRLSEADTIAEIASAKLLVLPSFMEGLPIVLMEAMALKVPVVASRVAGVPELIQDGIEGLLFQPSDWIDLRYKIEAVLTAKPFGACMSAAALQRIETEFDIRTAIIPLAYLLTSKSKPAVG